MFSNESLVGSAPIGKDGRITIPIRIREILSIVEGEDDLIFYLSKPNDDTDIITIKRGEMKWD